MILKIFEKHRSVMIILYQFITSVPFMCIDVIISLMTSNRFGVSLLAALFNRTMGSLVLSTSRYSFSKYMAERKTIAMR